MGPMMQATHSLNRLTRGQHGVWYNSQTVLPDGERFNIVHGTESNRKIMGKRKNRNRVGERREVRHKGPRNRDYLGKNL